MMEMVTARAIDSDEDVFTAEELERLEREPSFCAEVICAGQQATIMSMRRMARAVAIIVKNGWELPAGLNSGAVAGLLKIAYRQALPEVFVHFGNNMKAVRQIACLPIPEQERLIKGEPVKLLVFARDGSGYTDLVRSPREMKQAEWDQVLDEGGLRSLEEQRAWLERQRTKELIKKPKRNMDGGARVNKRAGGVEIAGVLYDRATIASWLVELG